MISVDTLLALLIDCADQKTIIRSEARGFGRGGQIICLAFETNVAVLTDAIGDLDLAQAVLINDEVRRTLGAHGSRVSQTIWKIGKTNLLVKR